VDSVILRQPCLTRQIGHERRTARVP